MPYLENQQEDEEDKKQEPLTLNGGQAGGAAPLTASPRDQAPVPAQTAGGTPGRFVNFERRFNANKDAATASGNRIAGGVEKQGQAVEADLKARQATFNDGVLQGGLAPTVTPSGSQGAVAPKAPPAPGGTKPPPGPMPDPFKDPAGYARWNQENAAAGKPPPPQMPSSSAPTPPQQTLEQRAAQTYKGPRALSDSAGWDELGQKAAKTSREGALTKDAAGTQALLQEEKKGSGYTQGQSRFDAGLTQAASGDRFARLRDRFSGLSKSIADADSDSQVQSATARGAIEGDAEKAKADIIRIQADKKARIEADIQAKLAEDARIKKERSALNLEQGTGRYEEWDDYTGGNRFENTLSNITGAMDPVDRIQNATGNRSVKEAAEEKMDTWANQNLGTHLNSSKYNWGLTGHLGAHSDEVKRAVFDSLSGEELKALERMGGTQQDAFIDARLQKLADFARDALKKLPPYDPRTGLTGWLQKIQSMFDITPQQLKQLQHLATVNPPRK